MYSQEIYKKAERILKKRQDNAQLELEMRTDEIKAKLPEIAEIQSKLSRIGLEISKIFFYKGNADEKIKELKAQSEALVAQRKKILSANGYSENAMSIEHICPACEDRGFINGRLCACHRQLLKDIMKEEIRRLAPIDSCTFDSFELAYYSDSPMGNAIVPRERAKKIFEACRRYAQNFSTDAKNLFFVGGTGLGKTHLSLAIANVVINRGYSVCYGTAQNICDDLQSEQFGRGDDAYYSKRQVLDCDLLILDDLGTEISNQYSLATLYNIINTRILSKKPTVISTNFSLKKLEQRYDQRITSRINGEYITFNIFGNDIRNIK